MDALAQLALMTKAKLMFESPDTFLSFPALMPISYAPDQMKFADASTVQQLQAFADFSTWTNSLPQGTLFPSSPTDMLWDVYRGVLDNAQVAQGSLTPDESASLAAAQSFLTTQGGEGVLVDTPEVVAYKQYQQAYFAANQDYNNQNITATTSSDPGVRAAWTNGGDAAARAAVQSAESDWEAKGYKAQVEQAQLVAKTLGAKSPQLKWGTWSALCNPDIDFPTSPSGGTFGPTIFTPANIADQPNWPSFSVVGGDIPNLVSQAPAELKSLFGSTSGASTIDTLSFEYCSVGLSRPWFKPELFTSKFWRFADANEQLSDGNSPPSGEWPAYICAVVFARNISVKMVSTGPAPPPRQFLPAFPILNTTLIRPVPQPAPRPLPLYLRSGIKLNQSIRSGPTAAAAVGVRVNTASVPMSRVAVMAPAAALPQERLMRQIGGVAISAPAAPARSNAIALNPALRARLSAAAFTMTPSQSGAPQPAPTPLVNNTISVLAFVCKKLPRCPDPDSSLKWS